MIYRTVLNVKLPMQFRIILAILLLSLAFKSKSQVVINEFSTSNTTNYGGGDEDWLELYNSAAFAVNIGGFYLSDKITNPTKWQIPTGTTIAANGYFRFFLSGNNVTTGPNLETNFKLTQSDQEWVVFSDATGALIESFQMLVPTPAGHSRGKSPNGSATWAFFTTPTPNAANGAVSYTGYAAKPIFSLAPGFYAGTQTVSLSCTTPNVDIRYTTNGSAPTVTSTLYSTPINIASTQIIRAQSFPQTGATILPSLLENNTYFINITHTLPVVSVSGDYGAATTGNNTFQPLDFNNIVTSIEYFDVAQQLQWESVGEMRRHGNDSWAYPQKGIRYHSMDRFGYSSTINYPLMQQSNRQKYDVIILKAGASDNYPTGAGPTSNRAHIRDVFVQTFAMKNGIDLDGRRYEPCILYVNGQYWGVYELRERVDTDFTDYYYNQPEDKVDMLRVWGGMNIDAGSDTAWYNLRDFVVNNNMAIPANYQHVADRLDINSFIDYFIYNQFLVNTDVFNWNTHWWRGRKNAGVKWRYCMWDMDNTFDLGQNFTGLPATDCNTSPCGYEGVLQNTTGTVTQPVMFSRLKQNPIFFQTYANRYAYLNNNILTCDKLIPHLDSLIARITPEFPGQLARWGGTMAQWQANVQGIRDFLTCRCNNILTSLVDCNPGLSGPYQVCVSSFPPNIGVITFDSTTVDTAQNCFTYFGGVDIPITAISNTPGYVFDYWQLTDGTIINGATFSSSALIQLLDSGLLIAHFKTSLLLTNDTSICIGETIQLNASGAGSYTWRDTSDPSVIISNQPQIVVSPNITTYYKVTTNLAVDSVKVTVKPLPIVSLGVDSLKLCDGDTLWKNILIGNAKYLWNDGDTNGVKPIVKDGIYIAKTNLEGCLNSDTVEYKFYKYPVAELGNDTTICLGKTIELLPTIEKDVLFKWSNSDTTSSITVDTKGEYIVDVVRNLCITSDTVYVDTEVCIPCRAYVPNAFTPNKDGKNDRYQVVFRDDKDCKLKVFQLQIFNRWGELIFETNDIKTEWIPPMLVTDNVYGYVLKYSFQDRGIYNTVYDMGSITLMK